MADAVRCPIYVLAHIFAIFPSISLAVVGEGVGKLKAKAFHNALYKYFKMTSELIKLNSIHMINGEFNAVSNNLWAI
jgi:hypothetical protein